LPTSLLRYQDYQYQLSLGQGVWRWTTRIDVSKANVSTQIREIISPYGLLRDSVPIPGEVAQAMADSITEVMSAYTPSILLNPVSLDFTVDEGRGMSLPIQVQVTNNGVLGSLLSTTVTTSAPYVRSTPANIGGLLANVSGHFDVSVDSAQLLAIASPYSTILTVQSAEATNSPQTIPVNIVVRPRPTISASPASLTFNVAQPFTGPYPPIPAQQLTLTNTGLPTSVLDYQIRKLQGVNWLVSFAPVYGSVNGGSSQPIAVLVSPDLSMSPGVYTETLRISGFSTNLTLDVPVTLNIS
jgi:hypothetical protein